MKTLRYRFIASLALVAAAAATAPAQAQVLRTDTFGRSVSDVQGYNLAGGGNYIEAYWPVSTHFRTYTDDNTTTFNQVTSGRQAATDTEVKGVAQSSYGAEIQLALPSTPWIFGTAEYRRSKYDQFRIRTGDGGTNYNDIPGGQDPHAGIGHIGAGVAIPQTPFYARAEYSFIYLDGLGVDRRFDGYGLHGGVAQPVTSFLGVKAEAGYQDIDVLGHGFEWKAGFNLNLTPQVALTGTYRSTQLHDNSGVNARMEDATVGLRFQFAN